MNYMASVRVKSAIGVPRVMKQVYRYKKCVPAILALVRCFVNRTRLQVPMYSVQNIVY